MVNVSDNMSIGDAKAWLRTMLDKGSNCPCCSQFSKIYKRKFHSGMAVALIKVFHLSKNHQAAGWIHINQNIPQIRDYGYLRFWNLLEPKLKNLDKETKDSGFWRLTDAGLKFLHNQIKVKSHIKIYDGRFFGFDGNDVSINDCLGKKFSYHELMNTL